MAPSLIHRLTEDGQLTTTGVVCGARDAAVASWDVARVTCPACTAPSPRRRPPGGMSEQAFQAAVTEALTRAGWTWYHTHDSRHSPAGFPDVVALRRETCLIIECKSATGTLTPAQQTWLAAWRRIVGIEVHVWRPDDLAQMLARLR